MRAIVSTDGAAAATDEAPPRPRTPSRSTFARSSASVQRRRRRPAASPRARRAAPTRWCALAQRGRSATAAAVGESTVRAAERRDAPRCDSTERRIVRASTSACVHSRADYQPAATRRAPQPPPPTTCSAARFQAQTARPLVASRRWPGHNCRGGGGAVPRPAQLRRAVLTAGLQGRTPPLARPCRRGGRLGGPLPHAAAAAARAQLPRAAAASSSRRWSKGGARCWTAEHRRRRVVGRRRAPARSEERHA